MNEWVNEYLSDLHKKDSLRRKSDFKVLTCGLDCGFSAIKYIA